MREVIPGHMADSRVQRPRRQTAGGRAGRVSPVWPDAGLCLRSHLVVRVVVVLVMMMESGASGDRHKLSELTFLVGVECVAEWE